MCPPRFRYLANAPLRLSRCGLTPGVPLKPMLAKICEGVADGLRQLGPGAPLLAEYKYDGVRAQIHLLPDGRVGGWCVVDKCN